MLEYMLHDVSKEKKVKTKFVLKYAKSILIVFDSDWDYKFINFL